MYAAYNAAFSLIGKDNTEGRATGVPLAAAEEPTGDSAMTVLQMLQ
jgi:hypothetical protein